MTIEVELKEIRSLLSELNKKMNYILEEIETEKALTVLEEQSLRDFLEKEPDIYTAEDVKAKVSCN